MMLYCKCSVCAEIVLTINICINDFVILKSVLWCCRIMYYLVKWVFLALWARWYLLLLSFSVCLFTQRGDWPMHKLECVAMCAYGENWCPSETVRLVARIIMKQVTY